MYLLRDDVLAGTAQGLHYTNLFYTYSGEIQSLLLADPALFDQAYDGLVLWIPNMETLVDGSGGDAVITQEQVDALDGALTGLSAVGSLGLQQTIADERAALLPLDDYVGLIMSQAEAAVLGGAPLPSPVYLPVMLKNSPASGPAAQPAHAPLRPSLFGALLAPQGGQCVLYCLLTGDCD